MRIWRFPDQVVRLGIVVAVAVGALIAARILLVPASFGEIGHYRADALDTILAQEPRYAGWQPCVECHDYEGEAKASSFHHSLSCEVCHGPALTHANNPDSVQPKIPRERGEVCLYCHSYLPARPTGFPQIIDAFHNPLQACIECHDPHDPTPPEIPEMCSACHAQIARTKAVSHHASLECETCHLTLPEHREDPRAFLPKKPTNRALCGGCHDEGADSEPQIPRIDVETHGGRYICWQCHYPHFPEG